MNRFSRVFKFIVIIQVIFNVGCQTTSQFDTSNSTSVTDLMSTDGTGLRIKAEPLSTKLQEQLFETGKLSCDSECTTPFGNLLGEVDSVPAFSNCQSSCIRPQYSFMDLKDKTISYHDADPEDPNQHYVGVIYQCVEYARRWWMINNGVTFGSVDSAHEIIYLKTGKDIYSKKAFPLGRSINGDARRPPTRGDLVVYYPQNSIPVWRYGHVAVVVDVDLNKGIVSLAEENYDNQLWENPKRYSRQIQLTFKNNSYTLFDSNPSGKPYKGGEIAGWIYPKPNN